MLRTPLIAAIESYSLRYPREISTSRRFLDFLAQPGQCLTRGNPKGHLTASAWVVHPDGKSALLLLHRKLGRWLQPGGHVEPGEEMDAAALREAGEESGIAALSLPAPEILDLDIHWIPARAQRGEPGHFHYDVRFLILARETALRPSNESLALAWHAWDDAIFARLDPSLLRLHRKWLHHPHYSPRSRFFQNS